MSRHVRVGAAAGLLLLFVARPALAQEGGEAAGEEPQQRFFERADAWRFELGTDTTFTLSDEGRASTNEANDRTSNFDRAHMRLYARLRHRDSVELVVDLFTVDTSAPWIYGLYLRLQPDRRVGVRLGVLPLVVGGWQDRAYPQRQPLINQPLLAQYLLPLRNDSVPQDADDLVSQRGRRGETRYDLGAPGNGTGIAVYYEHCWNPGVELFGQLGSVRYRAAVMAGPPGSPLARQRDHVAGPSFEGRLLWTGGDAFAVGASWARGPYLQTRVDAALPAGREAADYPQQYLGADARLRIGRVELNAEYGWNTLESPFVRERLDTHGYYGEVAVRLVGSLGVAGRLSGLVHSDLRTSQGRSLSWEANATRFELGAVYRLLDEHLAVKAGWQRTRLDLEPELVEGVSALQVAISY